MKRLPTDSETNVAADLGEIDGDGQRRTDDITRPEKLHGLDSGVVYGVSVRGERSYRRVRRSWFKHPSLARNYAQWHRSQGRTTKIVRYQISEPEIIEDWRSHE